MAFYRLLAKPGVRVIVDGVSNVTGGLVLDSADDSFANDSQYDGTWCIAIHNQDHDFSWCNCPEMMGPYSAIEMTLSDVQICCAGAFNPPYAPVRGPNGFPVCAYIDVAIGNFPCWAFYETGETNANIGGVDSCGVLTYSNSVGVIDTNCEYTPCMMPGQWNATNNGGSSPTEGFYNGGVIKLETGQYVAAVTWSYRQGIDAYGFLVFYAVFDWDFASTITVENQLTEANCNVYDTSYYQMGNLSQGAGNQGPIGYGGSITLVPKCTTAGCGTITPCTTTTPDPDCGVRSQCADPLPSSVTLDLSGVTSTGPGATCLDGQSVTACTEPVVLTASGTTYSSPNYSEDPGGGCSNGNCLVQAQITQTGTDPCSWQLSITTWCWFEFANNWVAGSYDWTGTYTGPTPQGTYTSNAGDGTTYTVD